MVVEFSAEAANDLERSADYIAKDNPRRALSFVQELRNKCEALAITPASFAMNDMESAAVSMGTT